jgi:hypothetical protein
MTCTETTSGPAGSRVAGLRRWPLVGPADAESPQQHADEFCAPTVSSASEGSTQRSLKTTWPHQPSPRPPSSKPGHCSRHLRAKPPPARRRPPHDLSADRKRAQSACALPPPSNPLRPRWPLSLAILWKACGMRNTTRRALSGACKMARRASEPRGPSAATRPRATRSRFRFDRQPALSLRLLSLRRTRFLGGRRRATAARCREQGSGRSRACPSRAST